MANQTVSDRLKAAEAALAKLEAENAQLKAQTQRVTRAVKLTVTPKGCLGITGIRGFPIAFYKGEWRKILDMAPQIEAFMAEHDAELAGEESKPSKEEMKRRYAERTLAKYDAVKAQGSRPTAETGRQVLWGDHNDS